MPTDITIFIVAALVANVLALGLLLALPRGRVPAQGEPPQPPGRWAPGGERRRPAVDKYALADVGQGQAAFGFRPGADAGYDRAVRVAWWVSIAAVLVGVGLSDAFPPNQPLIFAVGGIAAAAVVLLHELLPTRWRLPGRFWIEALIAVALVSALVFLTGRGQSPFVVGYALVAVAVALARGGRAAVIFASIASLAYLGVLWLEPRPVPSADELLRYGANLAGIWLLAGLAGAYASQDRRARSAFLQLSLTDPLTGLFNRSQIFATLDQEIRRTRRSERGFCILMIDLDGLKAVNDSLGHHRGDDVLRHLATVIRRSIRTVDTAYRYGGDEFVVLLPETDIVGAFVVAEKIRAGTEEIGTAVAIEGVEPSVSIGLVSHPEDGITVEELMIAADRAMYQAKSLGKNQISGYPRPRRVTPALPPVVESPTPVTAPSAAAAPPPSAATARGVPTTATVRPPPVEAVPPPVTPVSARQPRTGGAVPPPSELRPVEMAAAAPNGRNVTVQEGGEDEEPDPSEVRRQIANASRSFDPDHQIRRAMDAFLGPMAHDPRDR